MQMPPSAFPLPDSVSTDCSWDEKGSWEEGEEKLGHSGEKAVWYYGEREAGHHQKHSCDFTHFTVKLLDAFKS